MCGRYELSSHPAVIALAFGLARVPELAARYNIAPTQDVPIVRRNAGGERELVHVRWGFVPRWARDPAIGAHMINARAETVSSRYAFRHAYARHRCLVPANGFYEWCAMPYGKQPMHIGMPDARPFGLAGVYERWLSPDGEVIDSCAIVTTAAAPSVQHVHDRMPVIVDPAAYDRWLDASNADVGDLLAPFQGALRIYPVSTRVNAVRNDDADLCRPVEAIDSEAHHNDAQLKPANAGQRTPAEDEAEAQGPVQATLF
jgi:putative SOS response-associated peptidase YedK